MILNLGNVYTCGYIIYYGHKLVVRWLCYSAAFYRSLYLTKLLVQFSYGTKLPYYTTKSIPTKKERNQIIPNMFCCTTVGCASSWMCAVFVRGVSSMQMFWMFITCTRAFACTCFQVVVCLLLLYLNTNWILTELSLSPIPFTSNIFLSLPFYVLFHKLLLNAHKPSFPFSPMAI